MDYLHGEGDDYETGQGDDYEDGEEASDDEQQHEEGGAHEEESEEMSIYERAMGTAAEDEGPVLAPEPWRDKEHEW